MSITRRLTSSEELLIFQQFKEAVDDLKQDDVVLVRFLRARDFDLNSAEDMLRNAIQWRHEIEIENYLKWEFPKNYSSDLPYRYFGTDHEGSPICWLFMGKWNNAKSMVDNGEGEEILRWSYVLMERGLKRTEECDSPGNVIIDLDGLNYALAGHLPSLKLLLQGLIKFEKFYPEIIKSIVIINVPWIFPAVFTFVKGIISPTTMTKIKMFGYNKDEWYGELLQMFPKQSIVPELAK